MRARAQSCLTLSDPMDCNLLGTSVHGIFQARILEWVTISYSRGSSRLRDWTCVSCIGRLILYHCSSWETLKQNFFFFPNIHGGALSLFLFLLLLGLVSEISVNKYFTFFPHYFFPLYSGIIFWQRLFIFQNSHVFCGSWRQESKWGRTTLLANE